jgi:hypothetical protein
MAIDSETKRRSVLGMTIMSLVVAPLADGTISILDSMHITGYYGGITPQAGLQTDFLHIFSTGTIEPNRISDSGNNVLFAGQTEAQGGAFVGGAVNYWDVDSNGIQTFSGSSAINGLFIQTTRIDSSPYTALRTDDDIFVDTDGGAITINLPVGIDGKRYRIINTGSSSNDITIAPNGTELLTGDNANRTLSDRSVIILTYEPTEGWW